MTRQGLLIAICGIDGSGKTLQAGLLSKWIEEKGQVNVFHVPKIPSFGGWFLDCAAVQEGQLSSLDIFPPEVVEFVEASDRVRNLTQFIEKPLSYRNFMISERYTYCYLARSIMHGSSHIDSLRKIYALCPKPDITFFLNVSVETAVERVNKRGIDTETFERLAKLKKSYESLIEYREFCQIDSENSIEEVQREIRTKIIEYVTNYKKGNFNSLLEDKDWC